MPEPSSEFTKQFAIRLPNGLLHAHHAVNWTIENGVIMYSHDEDSVAEPVVYDSMEDAEHDIKVFQERAAHMGITEWLGRIETRRCSPFTDSRDGEGAVMMADLEKFLEDQ